MNAAILKTIAVLSMIIDHTASAFVENNTLLGQIMHGIGRLAFPIMAYFIVEGYNKTSNLKKYIKRMAIFAIITHIPFQLYVYQTTGDKYFTTSIMYTFMISLITLWVLENKEINNYIKPILILSLFILVIPGDYSIFGPLLVIAFNSQYGNKRKQMIAGSIIISGMVIITITQAKDQTLFMLGTYIPLLLLPYYNEKQGSTKNPIIRYGYYVIYPLQFIIIILILKYNVLG